MKRQLGSNKYALGEYLVNGTRRYGFIPSETTRPQVSASCMLQLGGTAKPRSVVRASTIDLIFGAFILGLLIVIVSYFKDASDSAFNRFFNRNAFGPRFILTSAGTLISANWKRVERGENNYYCHNVLAPNSPQRLA